MISPGPIQPKGLPARLAALAATVLFLPALGGCGLVNDLLGAKHGYLFQGVDVLCHPGETVELRARLEKGTFLGDKPNRAVAFSLAGRQFGQAVTDDEGYARLKCVAPSRPGNYRVIATLGDRKLAQQAGPTSLLLAVRLPDQRILVSDVDKTLVADGMGKVLTGHPRPMPDAVRVLRRLHREAGYTIVYLTLRPDFMEIRTRNWLAEYDFPEGPVFYSDEDALFKDRASYKPRVMKDLAARFPRVEVGVGDKAADCRAYCSAGVPTCLLIVHPQAKPKDRREQADRFAQLDASVQAVTTWRQIEQALFEQQRFPLADMLAWLRQPPAGGQ